jgi:hypothetical protein
MFNFLIENWKISLWALIISIPIIILTKDAIIYFYRIKQAKRLIYMRVMLPKAESQRDNEKETEKDFREKIGLMAQFFRNLHESRELNLMNIVISRIFRRNTFSFELVAHNKQVEFFITTDPYYKPIIENQVTSFYNDADIEYLDGPYEHCPKGNKLKGFFVYTTKPFWFPVKTFKEVENDPLNDLTNIFSGMDDGETAVIQLVVKPLNSRWTNKARKQGDLFFKGKEVSKMKIPLIGPFINLMKGIVLGADKMTIEKTDENTGFVRMLQAKEEVAKKIGEKAGRSGFDVVIRLLSTAKTEKRAEEISNNMITSFNLFRDNNSNWFQSKRLFFIDFINDILFLYSFKHRMLYNRFLFFGERRSLLSEEELASIFHFPTRRYNKSPIIKWLDYKVLPAPLTLPKEGILLGHNVYRGDKKEIRMLKKDRTRHFYILGKSGSGKSVMLSFMARQDAINGEGLCLIDPHGDLVDDVLNYVPKERAKDVIVFDPADQERPMGLNILEAKTPEEQDLISSQATEIFIKIFGDEIFGPRIQHYFRNACLTLMEDEEGATLIDIPRVFTDDAFLKYKVKKVTNPIVKSFWQNEYANTGDREKQEMIPYFSSKFGPFITNQIMRNTIGQVKSAFDFRKCMDEGKILLVKLSKGTIGDLNTQLLGLVMVARIQMAAMSRADMPEDQRKDFYLYVDEFQNFATDSFCSILSEARKYRLALIMAHQYISQLVVSKYGSQSTQIRDAVFGNVGSLGSFKVGAEDAEYLAKEYAPLLTEQDILGISNYKLYLKLNINNTTSQPFSVNTIYDLTGKNEERAKKIRDISRLKYSRKKEFVDQEITARIGIEFDSPAVDLDKKEGDGGNPLAKILGG